MEKEPTKLTQIWLRNAAFSRQVAFHNRCVPCLKHIISVCMEKELTKLTQIWLRNAAFSARANDPSLSHVGALLADGMLFLTASIVLLLIEQH
jgi:hypothetical protein